MIREEKVAKWPGARAEKERNLLLSNVFEIKEILDEGHFVWCRIVNNGIEFDKWVRKAQLKLISINKGRE